jgi:spermidine/putrescine transport system permease protein
MPRPRITLLGVYMTGMFIFLFAPLVFVVLFSFNSGSALTFPIRGLSLRWYREIFADSEVTGAMWNSVRVAISTAIVVTVVGTCTAIAMTRYRFRGQRAMGALVLIPAALPGLFIGISLVAMFSQLHIGLSLITVTIGHMLFTLPFFYLVAHARLAQFDPLLEESAEDLGANAWQRFRLVLLPMVAPALLGAALIVVALSWDEFLITFFTIGGSNTLPLLIWSKARLTIDPSVNAIATLLVAGSLLLVAFTRRFIVESHS